MQTTVKTMLIGVLVAGLTASLAVGQTSIVVEFPDPGRFYGNSSFAVSGDVGYAPTYDDDVLWSFSLDTGELLDPDGLVLPYPATASDAFYFPGDLVGVPGWFPDSGLFVADVSDPTNLTEVGIIDFPVGSSIQGQNVVMDDSGTIGFVASFPNDRLFSFNVATLSLVDANGLSLPGNPDRIAYANGRVAMVDTTNGRIMVADVSDPTDMTLLGTIDLPGTSTFSSDDTIVFAADGRTGFVTDNEAMLHSFDVVSMTALDPDGLYIGGTQVHGGNVAIYGDTLACQWSRGLTFVDVSDPSNLAVRAPANFGTTVSTAPGGTLAFTRDGTKAIVPVIWPNSCIYAFDVITGEQVASPVEVDPYPFFLTIYGADQVGALISDGDALIWLISGLFGTVDGDIDGDGDVDLADLAALLAAYDTCDGDPGYNPAADLDGSGCIDLADLATLLANYGYGT
jgi:hypothetical protein